MVRSSYQAWLACGALAFQGCNGAVPAPQTPSPVPVAPREQLERVVERYWDDIIKLNPLYPAGSGGRRFGNVLDSANSPQSLADSLALERRNLAELSMIPRAALDAESGLTYDIFRRGRVLAAESYRYPAELLPVNPYDGVPQRFALASSSAARTIAGDKDLEAWRLQAHLFVAWTRQAIINMRDGMRRGYVLPRVLVEKTLPTLAELGTDAPGNPLYAAEGMAAINATVRDEVLPAYRSLHDFLQGEYLPRARDTVALSSLPLGDAWYAFLIKRETGGARAPQELHALGVAEVDRLHGRVQSLLSESSFAGNAASFLDVMRHDPRFAYRTPAELLAAVRELKTQTAAALPSVFSSAPHQDVEIRSGQGFGARNAPLLQYFRVRANDRTLANLYVNTAGLDVWPATAMAAGFLREAVPGRHFLLASDHERTGLPRFRRFAGEGAFVEGWGLYAVGLGDELGLYTTPEARFGALLLQLTCAADLVIDTGVHAQGWTRAQALDYLKAQVPLDPVAAENLVDRAIALPAEGVDCTFGERRLQAIKARAQQALAGRFDLKNFHEAILAEGMMPFDLLDQTMKRWMDAPPKTD